MAPQARAAQEFVPVEEVRDGVMVLKNGDIRAVILVNSINLSLKSADEQQAVLMQFQAFLNSLDFSTQISIQSRRKDLRPYLLLLEQRYAQQTEPLLKIQTREYIDFIRQFGEEVAIMDKSFYVIVPYSPAVISSKGISSFFSKSKSKQDAILDFEEKRSQLDQRVSTVQQGLNRIGVRSEVLGTEEIIELLYKVFNPGEIHHAVTEK